MAATFTPWDGERIVEVTNDAGRTYRVVLRPNGKHEARQVIFGTLDNDLTPAERRAAIALAQSRGKPE
jgi:hypothetical protein